MSEAFQAFSTIAANSPAPGTTINLPITNNFTEDSSNTEAESQVTCRVGGVLSDIALRVSANSLSTAATTLKSRIGGSNGNQTLSVAAAATGYFVDNVNTDTISATNLFCAQIVVAAGGTGTITYKAGSMNFSATTNHGVYWGSAETSALFNDTSTAYFIRLAGDLGEATTEANIKMQVDVAGTLQNMQLYFDTNGNANTATATSRVNEGAGNQTASIAAAATGLFEDTTHTDSVVIGDDVNIGLTSGASTVSMRCNRAGMIFTNSASANDIFMGRRAPGNRTAGASATFYTIAGAISTSATETDVQLDHNFAATASKFKMYISANTYTGTATARVRKNTADGNQVISISAGTTGLLQDTSNSDTFIATDDFCYSIINGTANSLKTEWMGMLETVATTAIKTVNGLAYASVKTVNGLAVASVKTINGLA